MVCYLLRIRNRVIFLAAITNPKSPVTANKSDPGSVIPIPLSAEIAPVEAPRATTIRLPGPPPRSPVKVELQRPNR
jgi:hypothetical protein